MDPQQNGQSGPDGPAPSNDTSSLPDHKYGQFDHTSKPQPQPQPKPLDIPDLPISDTPPVQVAVEPVVSQAIPVSVEAAEDPLPAPKPVIKDPVAAQPKTSFKDKLPLKYMAVIAAVLALVGLMAGAFYVVNGSGSENTLKEPVEPLEIVVTPVGIDIGLVEGELEVSTDQGTSWRQTTASTEINIGDWVRTSDEPEDRAVISFDDGSVVRLASDSTISFVKSSSDAIDILLREGQVYARVSPVENRKFTISTSSLEATALGTAYRVSTSNESEVIEVFESSVKDGKTGNSVEEGKRMIFDKQSKQSRLDALDIELLKIDNFIVWNISQDSADEDFKDKLGFLDDTEAPELILDTPTTGQTLQIPEGATNVNVSFTGKSELGSTITVTDDGGASKSITVGAEKTFSIKIQGAAGARTFIVTAKDKRGNTTTAEVAVNLVGVQETTSAGDQISLAAIPQPGTGVALNWVFADGFSAPDGVRVLWNTSGDLTFPVTSALNNKKTGYLVYAHEPVKVKLAVSEPGGCFENEFGAKSVTGTNGTNLCLHDGQTYYFRVCRYQAATNTCDSYSNEIAVKAPVGYAE